ncbi:hypothetical protein VNO77_43579 [Canavalia gladiata]|uniref:Uncharacterized protein n=1 Tax=Canavalia gladiata TaxID=3824 RepID=A0AAN9JUC5_CANGL
MNELKQWNELYGEKDKGPPLLGVLEDAMGLYLSNSEKFDLPETSWLILSKIAAEEEEEKVSALKGWGDFLLHERRRQHRLPRIQCQSNSQFTIILDNKEEFGTMLVVEGDYYYTEYIYSNNLETESKPHDAVDPAYSESDEGS